MRAADTLKIGQFAAIASYFVQYCRISVYVIVRRLQKPVGTARLVRYIIVMPHFYFDVRTASDLAEDEDGAEFETISAAEEEARAAVLELAEYKLIEGLDEVSVEVRDQSGAVVICATASVSIRKKPGFY